MPLNLLILNALVDFGLQDGVEKYVMYAIDVKNAVGNELQFIRADEEKSLANS